MNLIVSTKIRSKLAEKHGVTVDEIEECFANCTGPTLLELRERHKTDPPSEWFIATTNYGKRLKVIFVKKSGRFFLKSAFPPNEEEENIYEKYCP